MNKNVLILSSGTRSKIVQYFVKEFAGEGKIIAADASLFAPALYVTDEYFQVPYITEPDYLETVLTICEREKIGLVITLIDPELNVLAKHQAEFDTLNTRLMVSDYELIETCFDKFLFAQSMQKIGLKSPKTFIDLDEAIDSISKGELKYPVFVKPRWGSASRLIGRAQNEEMLRFLYSQNKNMIIQEFMHGQEYGVDCYFDLNTGALVDMFIKKKLLMRAGETDKSISVHSPLIEQTVIEIAQTMKFQGVIDIDVFCDEEKCYVSEINPRFGGGYPHAYECGVNFPKLLLDNLNGIEHKPFVSLNYDEGISMMKYNDIVIGRINQKGKVVYEK